MHYRKLSLTFVIAMAFAGSSVTSFAEDKAEKEESRKIDLEIKVTPEMIKRWQKEMLMGDYVLNPNLPDAGGRGGRGGGGRGSGSPNTENIPPLKKPGPTGGSCGIGGHCGGWRFRF